MAFSTELRLKAFFRSPPASHDPSSNVLHLHWSHSLHVFRRNRYGILLLTEDEPVGHSCFSQFGFRFELLSEFRHQIWTSIASLNAPLPLCNFLYQNITSFAIDFTAERPTRLCPSFVIIADVNFVQRLYLDYAPRPLEFIQTASAFEDENLSLVTTTEGSEVDSDGFVDETFILGGTTEGWSGSEADTYNFFDENFVLGIPAEVDEDNDAGIEMLERTKRENWVMGGGEVVTCSVCLDDFSEGQEVMTMACKHSYHVQCILVWLDRNQTCPLCRRPI